MKEQNLSKIISKLFFAFVGYAIIAIVTLGIIGGMLNAASHNPPDYKVLDFAGQIIFTVLILIYAASGWLFCSYINGKFIKPWQIFRPDKEEFQSILYTK